MASNGTIPPDAILNPYTPLAFLPPDAADQFQVICYVYVATLAAYTWDWLMAMPEEYKMVRKVGFSPPVIAYFVSRFGTMGSCISTAVFRVAPIAHCWVLKYVEGIFFEIGVPATSLLFFFRVKAVYNHSRVITTFFGILWLAIAGLTILVMLGIEGVRIPYTRRCSEGITHTYTTVPVILAGMNDTLVFLAMSYRMMSFAIVNNTWSARAKSFFRGEGLHNLSKALLQSGQVYYFVTIGVAIISTALILSPSIPQELHPLLGSAYFALSSAMGCRVFRAVLLGVITDPQPNTARISSLYRAATNIQLDRDNSTKSRGTAQCHSQKVEINVAVEMDTTTESDDRFAVWDRKSAGDDASHLV